MSKIDIDGSIKDLYKIWCNGILAAYIVNTRQYYGTKPWKIEYQYLEDFDTDDVNEIVATATSKLAELNKK